MYKFKNKSDLCKTHNNFYINKIQVNNWSLLKKNDFIVNRCKIGAVCLNL